MRSDIFAAFPGSIFTTTDTLTDRYLNSVDAILLTSVENRTDPISPLTTDEVRALQQFVDRGGITLLFGDGDNFESSRESLFSPFGVHSEGTTGLVTSTVVTRGNRITDGFFGPVSSFENAIGGWLDDLGPNAIPLATLDFNGEVSHAYIPYGTFTPESGPVVFFGDTSVLRDDFRDAGTTTAILNTLAVPQVVPEPAGLLTIVGGFGLLLTRRR